MFRWKIQVVKSMLYVEVRKFIFPREIQVEKAVIVYPRKAVDYALYDSSLKSFSESEMEDLAKRYLTCCIVCN
jgi:hypothetical protein